MQFKNLNKAIMNEGIETENDIDVYQSTQTETYDNQEEIVPEVNQEAEWMHENQHENIIDPLADDTELLSPNNEPEYLTGSTGNEDGTIGPKFKLGDVVDVMPRLWAGINKPGGAARIAKINYDQEEDEYTYNVSYILHGGRELDVEGIYINILEANESVRRNTRGRCR